MYSLVPRHILMITVNPSIWLPEPLIWAYLLQYIQAGQMCLSGQQVTRITGYTLTMSLWRMCNYGEYQYTYITIEMQLLTTDSSIKISVNPMANTAMFGTRSIRSFFIWMFFGSFSSLQIAFFASLFIAKDITFYTPEPKYDWQNTIEFKSFLTIT